MPTSITPPPADDETECGNCGAYIYGTGSDPRGNDQEQSGSDSLESYLSRPG